VFERLHMTFERLHMPSLGGATAWLNSEPLGPAELRGHGVLVAQIHERLRVRRRFPGLGSPRRKTAARTTASLWSLSRAA
jgi:hypothetical protein